MFARIYKPTRTAMQSGNAAAERWMLEFEPELRQSADPLMGYTSTADMRRQIRLEFDNVQQAIDYAEKHGIPYRVSEPHQSAPKKMSYADNFRFGRPQPWTH
jgi:hypothetical protein